MAGSNKLQPPKAGGVRLLLVSKLESNPNQPRQEWDHSKDGSGKTKLERLAESIRAEGILQPLVLTPHNDKYTIVCGERQFRAARLLKLNEVPCIVRPDLDGILEVGERLAYPTSSGRLQKAHLTCDQS